MNQFSFFEAAQLDPPLKWAGGKRWLVPEFARLWSRHRERRLVEPFCGAAAITLGVQPKRALLSDLNPHLINFHRQLQAGLEINIPMEESDAVYYADRKLFNDLARAGHVTGRESASLFYYLNRTCFNGLCRFNQSGMFNVPHGKYKSINYMWDFTAYRDVYSKWTFSVGDFEQVALEDEDFIYADPPYDGDAEAFTGYAGIEFDWQDQVRLARWLARHPGPVVASNAATGRIVELYRGLGFELSERQVARNINSKGDKRGAVAEILALRNL
jgi:DNA adenine methylase